MKTTYLIIGAIIIFNLSRCKKPAPTEDEVTITGTIYLNCNQVAANKTYYFVFNSSYLYKEDPTITFTTDDNGLFTLKTHRKDNRAYGIYDKPYNGQLLGGFGVSNPDLSINYNIPPIYEKVDGNVVLKVKTNHVISVGDTIKYAFQYSNVLYAIPGPITKDTIVAVYQMSLVPYLYRSKGATGEQKTLWWNVNKPTVGTDDNQVDYTLHGCAAVADTAYIVVP